MIKYDEIDDMKKNSINTILERNGISGCAMGVDIWAGQIVLRKKA